MIEFLEATISRKTPDGVIAMCGSVGYGVILPESYKEKMVPGLPFSLFIHTYVREDIMRLYGFKTWEEKELFALLISIPSVGPSIALPIVDGISPADLLAAAQSESVEALKGIKGVGPKKSKRILMDVKTKLENRTDIVDSSVSVARPKREVAGASIDSEVRRDLVSALTNLGYREKEFQKVIDTLISESEEPKLEVLLRQALRELSGGNVQSQNSLFRENDL